MSEDHINRLSDDLLLLVFEELVPKEKSQHSLQLYEMLEVCKRWRVSIYSILCCLVSYLGALQTLFAPIYYRSIIILGNTALVSLAALLAAYEERRTPLSTCIRDIVVVEDGVPEWEPMHDPNYMDVLKTILALATELRTLELPHYTPDVMEVVLGACHSTLIEMRLTWANLDDSSPNLFFVPLFRHLRKLKLASEEPSYVLRSTFPWDLPLLQELIWDEWDQNRDEMRERAFDTDSDVMEFISRCQFPALRKAILITASQDVAPVMAFVQAHPHIQDVALMLDSQQYSSVLPLIRAPVLDISYMGQGASAMDHIPSCVHTLRLSIPSDTRRAYPYLNEVSTRLYYRPTAIRSVHLQYGGKMEIPFSWGSGRPWDVYGIATKWALALTVGLGIRVLDRDGMTLPEHFTHQSRRVCCLSRLRVWSVN
jgi:hypothetical protein